MYSDKDNINILTSIMSRSGIEHIIVCPGSRNAPLVHNFNEHTKFNCHSVTDERSAGFYAIGLSQAIERPVAVCVTSGTALLNLAPAVAEACYQHIPLLIISADRPVAWIDQQDGQTLPQSDFFGNLVSKSVNLQEPKDKIQRWHCNRLVNEAIMELQHNEASPVHINVQVSEPLFNFITPVLPSERLIKRIQVSDKIDSVYQSFLDEFADCSKPMLVIGQDNSLCKMHNLLEAIRDSVVVVADSLTGAGTNADEILAVIETEAEYFPEMVLYVGGDIVSKRLKKFLRNNTSAQWSVNASGRVYDTFMNLVAVIETRIETVLYDLAGKIQNKKHKEYTKSFVTRWRHIEEYVKDRVKSYNPEFSNFAAVKYFEEGLGRTTEKYRIQYANSSAIRLANIFSNHFVWSNRGVNGIEGSLSTAAGMSLGSKEKTFCVIGDLSFFYDQNALWNNELKGNFRILLLNNGGGNIFKRLPGLSESNAIGYIMAKHHTSAAGVCLQNNVEYMMALNMRQLKDGLVWLLGPSEGRPMLLEVTTTDKDEEAAWEEFYEYLKRNKL